MLQSPRVGHNLVTEHQQQSGNLYDVQCLYMYPMNNTVFSFGFNFHGQLILNCDADVYVVPWEEKVYPTVNCQSPGRV